MATFFAAVASGLVWMALLADLALLTFATGAALGLAFWRVGGAHARRPFAPIRALRLAWLGLGLAAFFLWELLVANVEQARIVLAPRVDVEPGWIRFRTELETPALRALLGAMLSLTPGSLTYEETPGEDGSMMIGLHVLDMRDEARQLAQVRRFEAPLRAMETL